MPTPESSLSLRREVLNGVVTIRREVDLRTIAICLGLLILSAAPLHAAEWSIGASGGFNYFVASEGGLGPIP